MTKFADVKAATASLTKNGFMKPKDPLLEITAKIAAFLCNDTEFQNALEQVSAKLWAAYRGHAPEVKHKFSRALAQVARDAGFRVDTGKSTDTGNSGKVSLEPVSIKLIGSDKVFVDMLRARIFWKDSMDLRHGEWSHALQWLAIQHKFKAQALQVYEQSADFQSKNGIVLWSWLADCFPNNAAGGDEQVSPATKETLKSESYRSPQKITDYLIGRPQALKGHFVSYYLHTTYQRRGLLTFKQPKHDPNAQKVADYGSLKDTLKDTLKDPNAKGWNTDHDNAARLLWKGSDKPQSATRQLGSEDVFHDVKGLIYL